MLSNSTIGDFLYSESHVVRSVSGVVWIDACAFQTAVMDMNSTIVVDKFANDMAALVNIERSTFSTSLNARFTNVSRLPMAVISRAMFRLLSSHVGGSTLNNPSNGTGGELDVFLSFLSLEDQPLATSLVDLTNVSFAGPSNNVSSVLSDGGASSTCRIVLQFLRTWWLESWSPLILLQATTFDHTDVHMTIEGPTAAATAIVPPNPQPASLPHTERPLLLMVNVNAWHAALRFYVVNVAGTCTRAVLVTQTTFGNTSMLISVKNSSLYGQAPPLFYLQSRALFAFGWVLAIKNTNASFSLLRVNIIAQGSQLVFWHPPVSLSIEGLAVINASLIEVSDTVGCEALLLDVLLDNVTLRHNQSVTRASIAMLPASISAFGLTVRHSANWRFDSILSVAHLIIPTAHSPNARVDVGKDFRCVFEHSDGSLGTFFGNESRGAVAWVSATATVQVSLASRLLVGPVEWAALRPDAILIPMDSPDLRVWIDSNSVVTWNATNHRGSLKDAPMNPLLLPPATAGTVEIVDSNVTVWLSAGSGTRLFRGLGNRSVFWLLTRSHFDFSYPAELAGPSETVSPTSSLIDTTQDDDQGPSSASSLFSLFVHECTFRNAPRFLLALSVNSQVMLDLSGNCTQWCPRTSAVIVPGRPTTAACYGLTQMSFPPWQRGLISFDAPSSCRANESFSLTETQSPQASSTLSVTSDPTTESSGSETPSRGDSRSLTLPHSRSVLLNITQSMEISGSDPLSATRTYAVSPTATLLVSGTVSTTVSASRELPAGLAASAVPEGLARGAQVASGITLAAGVLGGAAAAGPAVSLAILTMMSCSPAEQKRSNSATQYLVAPLIDFGRDAAAAGNVGIVAAVLVLHYAASRAIGADRARFPGLSVTLAAMLCGGTLALGFGVLVAARAGERWWVGALLVALVAGQLAAHRWFLWRRLLPRLSYVERSPPHPSRALRLLLPGGDWLPLALRQQYSPLVNPVAGPGLARAWSLWNVPHTVVYSFVASFAPGSASGCVAQLGVLAAWCWAVALLVACVRPHRVPLSDALACAGLVLTAAAVTLTAAYQAVAADGGTVGGLLTALVVVTMLQVVLTVLKLAHSLWLQWMERERAAALAALYNKEAAADDGAEEEEDGEDLPEHDSILGELVVASGMPSIDSIAAVQAERRRAGLVAAFERRMTTADTIQTLLEIRATATRRQTWRTLRCATPTAADRLHDEAIDRQLLEALLFLACPSETRYSNAND